MVKYIIHGQQNKCIERLSMFYLTLLGGRTRVMGCNINYVVFGHMDGHSDSG